MRAWIASRHSKTTVTEKKIEWEETTLPVLKGFHHLGKNLSFLSFSDFCSMDIFQTFIFLGLCNREKRKPSILPSRNPTHVSSLYGRMLHQLSSRPDLTFSILQYTLNAISPLRSKKFPFRWFLIREFLALLGILLLFSH